MALATLPGGRLIDIEDCYVSVPTKGTEKKIVFNVLPEISDQKSATYNDEPVIGRSNPMKTYGSSDNRSISMQIHLIVTRPEDVEKNLEILRVLESAIYPRVGASVGVPFVPPPVCQLRCGQLLKKEGDLCAVLKQYSVKFPTDISWDETTFAPFKLDIDTTWEVVYKSSELPGQQNIIDLGG